MSIPASGAIRILIADDDPWWRSRLAEALTLHDFMVVKVSDLPSALRAVVWFRPALLLASDRVGGFDLLNQLRSEPAAARLAVIILSEDNTGADDRFEALSLGAVATLLREEPLETLVSEIGSYAIQAVGPPFIDRISADQAAKTTHSTPPIPMRSAS